MGKQTGKNMRRKQAGKENAKPEHLNDSLLENILGENIDEVVGRRSEVGKRSLGLVDADNSIDDVEVNDDKKEKEERKRQLEEKKELENAGVAKTQYGTLSNLTQAELEQHYTKCIDMVNRNKVNLKNAFKLQLIDYMKTIVSNQWSNSENLTLMSCTLGASAKIYECRVDKVYADMIKIVSNKGKVEKDDTDDENDNEEDGGERPKKKRKKYSNSGDEDDDGDLIPDIDMEQMLMKEDELQKSKVDKEILERALLPRGLEYFVEAKVADSNSMIILNYPLFSNENLDLSNSDVVISEPYYTGDYPTFDLCHCIPNYKDIRKCFSIVGEEESSEEHLDLVNSSMAYDPSTNINLPDSIRVDGENPDMECDGTAPDTWVPDYDEENLPEADLTGIKSGQVSSVQPRLYTVEDMSQFVSTKSSDYSFFDNSRVDFLAGPRHWRFKRSKPADKNQKPAEQIKKQKKNLTLEFNAEQAGEANKFYKDIVNPQLARRTILTWSSSKLKNPPEISFSQKTLLGLTKNENILYIKKESNKTMIHDDNNDDDNMHMMNPDDFGVEPEHNDDDDLERDNDNLEREVREVTPDNSSRLEENIADMEVPDSAYELVPAPFRVNKIPLKFAKEPKRVDIKGLKAVIWETMNLEEENSKSVEFSEVYAQLANKLPSDEASDVGFPIAFMSLLHMANEKTLALKGREDYSDISVSLGQ